MNKIELSYFIVDEFYEINTHDEAVVPDNYKETRNLESYFNRWKEHSIFQFKGFDGGDRLEFLIIMTNYIDDEVGKTIKCTIGSYRCQNMKHIKFKENE